MTGWNIEYTPAMNVESTRHVFEGYLTLVERVKGVEWRNVITFFLPLFLFFFHSGGKGVGGGMIGKQGERERGRERAWSGHAWGEGCHHVSHDEWESCQSRIARRHGAIVRVTLAETYRECNLCRPTTSDSYQTWQALTGNRQTFHPFAGEI